MDYATGLARWTVACTSACQALAKERHALKADVRAAEGPLRQSSRIWSKDMSLEETKDLAYWERNVLALRYADGWYNDLENCYPGWLRVLSLDGGKITFHIPDDFNVGNLPEIAPNWDGHTTEEKWQRLLELRGVRSLEVEGGEGMTDLHQKVLERVTSNMRGRDAMWVKGVTLDSVLPIITQLLKMNEELVSALEDAQWMFEELGAAQAKACEQALTANQAQMEKLAEGEKE
jgi:hypothetical protein